MSDAAVVFAPTVTAGSTRINAGATLGGTVPTISEINGSYTHFNQIIALYNRRASQIFASPTPLSYIDPSVGKIPASAINALRTAINAMRAAIGQSAYSFGASLTAGSSMIKASHISDLRSAMGLVPVSIGDTAHKVGTRTDAPFGTQTALSTGMIDVAHNSIGTSGTSSNATRSRFGGSILLPSSLDFTILSSAVIGKLQFQLYADRASAVDLRAYCSNSDDHAYSSTLWQQNLDSLCGDVSVQLTATGIYQISVPNAVLLARNNAYASFILGHKLEMQDSYVADTTRILFTPAVMSLVFDFGF